MDPSGTSFNQALDTDFPVDATFVWAKVFVAGEDGKEIGLEEGIYPHHVIFVSPSRFTMDNILSCGGRRLPVPQLAAFLGASAETFANRYTIKDSPVNTGVYIPKGEKIFLQVDIVNSKDYDQNVFLVTELEYLPGKPAGYLDSSQYIISPNSCDSALGVVAGQSIKPPPGVKKFHINGTDMTFTTDGYIVYSRESSKAFNSDND
jgi:hypothetical protein